MITKFMCTVETKNYPINTIRPAIQRYGSVKKKLNATEIACCLASYASVTLHKNTGENVKLNGSNFKKILTDYAEQLANIEIGTAVNKNIRNNREELEKLREENTVTNTKKKELKKAVTPVVEEKNEEEIVPAESESLEEMQSDPENPETEDFSYIDSEE